MRPDELHRLDALAQAELVHRRDVSPRELVEAAIERAETIGEPLGVVVTPLFERALAACDTLWERPFGGVPMFVKDFLATIAGVPHRAGSRFLDDHVATTTSTLVARYEAAGMSILGTSRTPELALLSSTEPLAQRPARNPWDPSRSAGGSSGGSAAAVAAGIVPVAHGNDAGGSLRIPASDCGVFGLKPSRARNPLAPAYGDLAAGLWCEHVITRSVRDSAALLDATAGPAVGDPYVAHPPGGGFRAATQQPPMRLRVALSRRRLDGSPLHPDCLAAADVAAELCAALGHEVEEAAPEIEHERAGEAFMGLIADGVAALVDHFSDRLGRPPADGDLEPLTERFVALGRERSAARHLRDVETLQLATRALARFAERYDVWLTPTNGVPPLPLGAMVGSLPLETMLARDAELTPFAWIANCTGQPAMSVPLHATRDGLPVGAHFLGPPGGERLLLALAAQLERARPWADRRPPAALQVG